MGSTIIYEVEMPKLPLCIIEDGINRFRKIGMLKKVYQVRFDEPS